jgi:hypothetical protein
MASEDFLLRLSASICQSVVSQNYTNTLNGFERKDPSVRFSVIMTNIFVTLLRFDKHIRFHPQVKMWGDT